MDRPTFSELKLHLEKILESLPALGEPSSVIYINTNLQEANAKELMEDYEFPQIDTVLDPNEIIQSCSQRPEPTVVTVDIHESSETGDRYVLSGVSGEHQASLVRTEEEEISLLQITHLQDGMQWSQASTLPVGSTLTNELLFADDSLEESEILL